MYEAVQNVVCLQLLLELKKQANSSSVAFPTGLMKAQLILGSKGCQYLCFMGSCMILLLKICGGNESGLSLAITQSVALFFRLASYWDFLLFFTLGGKSATGSV